MSTDVRKVPAQALTTSTCARGDMLLSIASSRQALAYKPWGVIGPTPTTCRWMRVRLPHISRIYSNSSSSRDNIALLGLLGIALQTRASMHAPSACFIMSRCPGSVHHLQEQFLANARAQIKRATCLMLFAYSCFVSLHKHASSNSCRTGNVCSYSIIQLRDL